MAIVVENVSKSFGEVKAVRGVHLQVREGELLGVIGPDGAGKTTLLRMICTLLKPDEGQISVLGLDTQKDIARIRSFLGYMPQRFSLYPDLTVEQNLRFFANLFQVSRKEQEQRLPQLYRFSRLGPFRKRLAGQLSGGMKQKLALSCALVHTPKILVLDEPTTGVDPLSRQEFWNIVRHIQSEGTTIVISTPYLEEANYCDRVALMFQGRIAALDTPENLVRAFPWVVFRVQGSNWRRLRVFFQQQSEVQFLQVFGDAIHVCFRQEPPSRQWQQWQKQLQGELQNWEKVSPSIEDVFLVKMEKEFSL